MFDDNPPAPVDGGRAALSYVERGGKVLCVWNRRWQTWGLPGGKVEDFEDVCDAQWRELFEETGISEGLATFVHKAPSASGSGRMVHVFHVETDAEPHQVEPDSPIAWKTREELMAQSAWSAFYAGAFAAVDAHKDWVARGRPGYVVKATL